MFRSELLKVVTICNNREVMSLDWNDDFVSYHIFTVEPKSFYGMCLI